MDESASNGLGLHPGSEEILQSFASHPYQSLDADGMIAAVNDAWLDCLGYEREDIIGRWYGDILTNDSRKTFEARFDEFKSSGGASNVEFEITRSDGDMVIVSFDGVIEYDDQGNFVRTHCQFKDITDWKYRRTLFENSSDVIMILDKNGRAKYVSPSVKRVMGYDPEELRG
ncbi:MAG: PAS domain-containing protein, partial [Halodesulfurarchaeum sp.]